MELSNIYNEIYHEKEIIEFIKNNIINIQTKQQLLNEKLYNNISIDTFNEKQIIMEIKTLENEEEILLNKILKHLEKLDSLNLSLEQNYNHFT